jgi:heme/copper-type cytochrome/quinol oxidase subunit 2
MILVPASTSASAIVELSMLVVAIAGVVVVVVASLLVYAVARFRATPANGDREPAQVYGT